MSLFILCVYFQTPGKKNKLRVYYLSWLRNKILRNDPEVEKRQGWVSVGDLEGCVHYKVGEVIFCSFLAELLNHPFASHATGVFLHLCFKIALGWLLLNLLVLHGRCFAACQSRSHLSLHMVLWLCPVKAGRREYQHCSAQPVV